MAGTVEIVRGRQWRLFAVSMLFAGIVLSVCRCVFALDPTLDVSQYAHNAWKLREGFTKGRITAIAQTPDGYIWLGTDFGLYRFDGVRNVLWQPPPGQYLPSSSVFSLLAGRDGTLWIGTDKGLANFKDGKLAHYDDLAGMFVFHILEDRDGVIWAGAVGIPTGRLCAIQGGTTHCNGTDGSLGHGVSALYEDSKGYLWAGVNNGFWRWKPGTSTFYPVPGASSISSFVEGDRHQLLFQAGNGIKQLVNGRIEPYSLPDNLRDLRVARMLRDREGSLWIATFDRGVVHVHRGKTDGFMRSDGLSGDLVNGLFEDREGNIWTVTSGGLDRFREIAVATVSADQGLSNATVWAVLADKDGSLWLSTMGGLNRWDNGQVTIPRTGAEKIDGKLDGEAPNLLFQDSHGRIWVSTKRGLGYLEGDRFVLLPGFPGETVRDMVEDNAGNLWVAEQESGLFQLSPRGEVQQIPWAGLEDKSFANALIADRLQGGLWLGFFRGGISYFNDGAIRASYGSGDGLGAGAVHSFRFDEDGTLWVSTAGGLSRLKNGRVATLSSKNGLPCDPVHWMVEDNDGSIWLHMGCGLVHVARSDINAWAAAMDRDATRDDKESKPAILPAIRPTVFDSSDGVATRAYPAGFRPLVAASSDGKLWFTGDEGVSVLDPKHIPFNKLPPPVEIEQIIADHKTYDFTPDSGGRVRLPPRVRDLQIDYTALSLVAPEKVFFRYKLEGWDRDWQEAGTRRQAFYSNLPPRKFTFRVKACNNSGVWNEAGTSLDFAIAPAYWQTWWFRSLCAAAFLGLLLAAYRLRLQQLDQKFNLRMEGRVAERTRIARDLHDTLLQSFQGVLLKFQAVSYMLQDRPEAQQALEKVIDQAQQAVIEGRDAVQGLRSSAMAGNDLVYAIRMLGEELTSHETGNHSPNFYVQVEGTAREIAPVPRDDIYRIAGEAVRNAFRHSQAGRVEVEIRYDARQLRLRVRDDGKGMEAKVRDGGERPGHYGLAGMHERAKLVGGKLTVWSEREAGTEAELTIPGSIAYAKAATVRGAKGA